MPPLRRLAAQHPQRLYCPVRLAQHSWQQLQQPGATGATGGDAEIDIADKTNAEARYAELAELTAGETAVREFVEALDALTYPQQRWQWHVQQMLRAVQAGRPREAQAHWRAQAWPSLFGQVRDGEGGR